MVDLGIAEGILEGVSSVLGLKTLASLPQSRGGSVREHSYEGGVQEDWGAVSSAPRVLGYSGRPEEPSARPREP